MKTAMQMHIEYIKDCIEIAEEFAKPIVNALKLCLADAEQKLAWEKEQMCECYNEGLYQDVHSDTLLPFEQYYNETFKSE